ncbi:hypothetical protein [Rhodococcus sp. A5(2022)]|uniref:hypothetical protein n=1 Tax=Rhodococcus sp. A5(2022) TaxID=3003588 RepID=UPI0022A8D1B6|nr:hypothetical protein [Rhodococcus sp. A5(2022)]MCZ1070798.1 hypothetical protein [Rhodococcus sp. A5(2022)]
MSAAFPLPESDRIEQLETTIAREVRQIDDLQRELVAAKTQRDKTRDLLEVKERQALAHAGENATLKRELDDTLKENARVKADLTRCLRLLGQGLDLADTWRGTCEWADAVHTALTHLPEGHH